MTIPCRFVELPKLRSGRVELDWRQIDLYGLLFWRLSNLSGSLPTAAESFRQLVEEAGIATPTDDVERRRNWPLISDREAQNKVTNLIAGLYMGKTNKKGGTYDWPYKHLGDASGKVTPRSFIKLFVEASKYGQAPAGQVISAEGIRHGLRRGFKGSCGLNWESSMVGSRERLPRLPAFGFPARNKPFSIAGRKATRSR